MTKVINKIQIQLTVLELMHILLALNNAGCPCNIMADEEYIKHITIDNIDYIFKACWNYKRETDWECISHDIQLVGNNIYEFKV